jgi:RNA polymerase sigma factor (sigma-70 family)
MTKDQEHQLIQNIRKGSQSAATSLYEGYEAYWFRICLRYARNRSEAQDIFQEGAVLVFRYLDKFDETKGEFKNWSAKIMVNAALQYLRKFQWQHSFEDLEMAETTMDDTENILGKLSMKELISIVQQLPTGYRVIFNMYEIEGYNHPEIAEAMHISVGTSKSQLAKAKKALRQKLNTLF